MDRADSDAVSEATELEDLMKSPGWLRVLQRARQEWGPKAYAQMLEHAIDATDPSGEMRSLKRAQHAVDAILSWPDSRHKELMKQDATERQPEDHSRRGPL